MLFDIICLIIIVAGFVFGYKRGIIAQIGSIIGISLGIVFCHIFAGRLAESFCDPSDDISTILLAKIMSFFIIFAICYIGGRLLGTAASGIVKTIHLGFLNKLLGAVFTMAEYTLFLSLILNAWIAAFPATRILSNYDGVKQFVIDFAPDILGNSDVTDIFSKLADGIATSANNAASHIETAQ